MGRRRLGNMGAGRRNRVGRGFFWTREGVGVSWRKKEIGIRLLGPIGGHALYVGGGGRVATDPSGDIQFFPIDYQ
jgi:hypothetical protein